MPTAWPRSTDSDHAVDRPHEPARRAEVGDEVGDLQQRLVGSRSAGSQIAARRMSRRRATASPIRLNDSTVRNSSRHGKIVAHQPTSILLRFSLDQLAPRRRRVLDAEAEERQRTLGRDQDAESGERHREHRRHQVGQDLAREHAAWSARRGCGRRARTRARAGSASGRARCGRAGRSPAGRA